MTYSYEKKIRRTRVDGCDPECVGDDFPPVYIQIAQAINLTSREISGETLFSQLYAGSELYAFLKNDPKVLEKAELIFDDIFAPTMGHLIVYGEEEYDSCKLELRPVGERP